MSVCLNILFTNRFFTVSVRRTEIRQVNLIFREPVAIGRPNEATRHNEQGDGRRPEPARDDPVRIGETDR